MVDAALNAPPVRLQLGFARSPGSNSAAKLRHRLAPARQAWQHVLKLRQLHLKLALARPCVARKNVQDQLCPVKHPAGQRRIQVAQLGRRQIVIEAHHVRLGGCDNARDLLNLAGPDQRRRIGP